MDPFVEQLKQSPRLSLVAEEIQAHLEAERERRERFYETVSEEEKAEFINGEIIVHSPVSMRHNLVLKLLLKLLDTYVEQHGLGYVGYEKIMISLTRNDYEPDLCYFGPEKAAQLEPQQTRFPAPDFIVEIVSPSTEARDRGVKFEDYAAHGVGEYWLIDPEAEIVEKYVLEPAEETSAAGARYTLRLKVNSGELAASAVPGLKIPVRAVFDRKENLSALQRLLQSREDGG